MLRASERDGELRARDLALDRAIRNVTQRSLPLVFVVQSAILGAYRGVKGEPLNALKDAEILEAVANAKQNLETEDTGLIYEHQAPPRVEALSRAIREALNDINERTPVESRFRQGEVLKLLELMHAWINAHMRTGEFDNSYLRQISLFIPWPLEQTQPLIV